MDAVKLVRKFQTALNILLVFWATLIIGYALPEDHGYHGGWIFGLAWFPILLFATVEIVSMVNLSKRLIPALFAFVFPYGLVAINIFGGTRINLENFVVQYAMLHFTASMLAFALQAVVFPFIYGTAQKTENFFAAEAFPQLFGAALGLGVSWFAFSFLLTYNIMTPHDLPIIFIGILQGGISIGRTLYKSRYE